MTSCARTKLSILRQFQELCTEDSTIIINTCLWATYTMWSQISHIGLSIIVAIFTAKLAVNLIIYFTNFYRTLVEMRTALPMVLRFPLSCKPCAHSWVCSLSSSTTSFPDCWFESVILISWAMAFPDSWVCMSMPSCAAGNYGTGDPEWSSVTNSGCNLSSDVSATLVVRHDSRVAVWENDVTTLPQASASAIIFCLISSRSGITYLNLPITTLAVAGALLLPFFALSQPHLLCFYPSHVPPPLHSAPPGGHLQLPDVAPLFWRMPWWSSHAWISFQTMVPEYPSPSAFSPCWLPPPMITGKTIVSLEWWHYFHDTCTHKYLRPEAWPLYGWSSKTKSVAHSLMFPGTCETGTLIETSFK